MNVINAPLPANPNCVLFATDASALLGRRTHGQLMREMMMLAAPFHSRSGLDTLVGLGCRIVADRRNQESVQATAFFVFDGPATAEHLAVLEQSVADGPQTFESSSIERVPAEAVWAGLWRSGRPHLIVEPDFDDPGEPARWYVRAWEWQPDYEPPAEIVAVDGDSETLPPWTRLAPIEAPYTPAEEAVERMRLAFALHHALQIVETSGAARTSHREYFDELFPPDLIERLGLERPSDRAVVLDEARTVLPAALGHHDKLAMVGLLFSVSFTDGPLTAGQMRDLRDAAHELGVTNEQVVAYLQRLW